ncbi:hypothetical protein BJV74DRAFT_262165 [Russula compacta]|nr:hypothetical protein BJV74DRAFT_262165 [Russula compacta]
MSSWRYIVSIERCLITPLGGGGGGGKGWGTYVKDGDISSLHHRMVWACDLHALTEHPRRHHWISGPSFPSNIFCSSKALDDEGQDNIIAALEHHDRVIEIEIRDQKCLALENLAVATQKSFSVVEYLHLSSTDNIAPVLHEDFLGGSAPHLRTFALHSIAFPAFPQLALSATHLSYLALLNIPIAGYISPEAMATCLATLPSLRWLSIGLQSPQSRPDRIGLPPPTRAVLPALINFSFKGINEYLEDLVARIDTPKLIWLDIVLFADLMFNILQLYKFVTRTEGIKPYNLANITFSATRIRIFLGYVGLRISCREPDWQASSMAQVCNQLSPLTSRVESLEIRENTPGQARQGNGIDATQWFELFDSFPAMQDLHIHDKLRPLVARALQELTEERATEVLPTLRRLYFKGPSLPGSIREDVQTFIAARQNSNHPVEVHWD